MQFNRVGRIVIGVNAITAEVRLSDLDVCI